MWKKNKNHLNSTDTYEKIRVFQLEEGPSQYLVYLVLYLAREIIGKLLLYLIVGQTTVTLRDIAITASRLLVNELLTSL